MGSGGCSKGSWSRAGTAGVLHWLFPKTRSAGSSAAGVNVVLVPGCFVLLGPSLCSHCCYSFFFFCGSSLRFSCFLPSCRQHRTVITGLTFSPDGNFMFSSCLQGTLALYSSVVPKSHVLRVLGKTLGLRVAFFPPNFCSSTDIPAPKSSQMQPTQRGVLWRTF